MQMGTYRLCYKKGKKGYAKNHAAYILREENYKGKEDLVYKECGNIPFTDGSNAIKFWEYADVYERQNSVAYREMELNIPNELSHEQAKELIQNFVQKEFSTKFPYTFAIHESYNKDGEKNLHCHLMFSERELDGISRHDELFFRQANTKNPSKGGAEKNRIWQKKEKLLELRKSWEIEQNLALEKYGLETRVDCRSLREIRKEALEKGNFQRAEELDRTPVNISGKILYKVDHKMKLTEEEKKKYQTFLRAKEEKKIKEKNIEILPKEEMIEYIDHSKKYSIEDSALNICTKGAYFRMKRTKSQVKKELVKYPDNVELQNHYEGISNEIINTENQWKNTLKFKNISEQLERDHKRELEKLNTLFSVKFGEKYEEAKEAVEQKNFFETLERKYQNYDILKLKIKESMLAVENTEYKAVNILSQYDYDKQLQRFANNIATISKLEEQKQEAQFYYPKEVSMLDAQLVHYEKKQQEITRELIKQNEIVRQDKNFITLSKKIQEKNTKEQAFLRKKIQEALNPGNYYREKIQLMNRYSFLEKLYEQYSKENIEPKRLYSISLEKEAIDVLFQKEYQKEAIPKSRETLEILLPLKEEIQKNHSKIQKQEKIEKLFTNILESKYKGMTGTEVLAMNKLTKGQYSKNYKIQRELARNIVLDKQTLMKMGIFSRGKNQLQEKIIREERILNQYQREEERLYLQYKTNPNLKIEAEKIEKSCKIAIEKIQRKLIAIKTEQKINYQLQRSLEGKPEKAKRLPKMEYSKHTAKGQKVQREVKGNFSRVLQHARYELDKILAADKTEIQSTLDITLKKEKDKGYEWEL